MKKAIDLKINDTVYTLSSPYSDGKGFKVKEWKVKELKLTNSGLRVNTDVYGHGDGSLFSPIESTISADKNIYLNAKDANDRKKELNSLEVEKLIKEKEDTIKIIARIEGL